MIKCEAEELPRVYIWFCSSVQNRLRKIQREYEDNKRIWMFMKECKAFFCVRKIRTFMPNTFFTGLDLEFGPHSTDRQPHSRDWDSEVELLQPERDQLDALRRADLRRGQGHCAWGIRKEVKRQAQLPVSSGRILHRPLRVSCCLLRICILNEQFIRHCGATPGCIRNINYKRNQYWGQLRNLCKWLII